MVTMALSLIVGALVPGAVAATKDAATQAIKDGYSALKSLIVRKFGQQSDVEGAVKQLEGNPNSKPRQDVVQEEMEKTSAAQDQEIVAQAKALLDLLKQQGQISESQYSVIVSGSGAAAVGDHAVAAGAGGV